MSEKGAEQPGELGKGRPKRRLRFGIGILGCVLLKTPSFCSSAFGLCNSFSEVLRLGPFGLPPPVPVPGGRGAPRSELRGQPSRVGIIQEQKEKFNFFPCSILRKTSPPLDAAPPSPLLYWRPMNFSSCFNALNMSSNDISSSNKTSSSLNATSSAYAALSSLHS